MSQPRHDIRALLARHPRRQLVHGPTPLHRLQAGGSHGVWIKRDDCTGLAFGGNKTRKLEFTLGAALARDATALVTASGLQSNHVRQTAAAAAMLRLDFHAIVFPPLDRFAEGHLTSGNLFLDGLLGARLHLVETEADLDAEVQDVMTRLQAAGEIPYLIPLGASDGIGSLGYVLAARELLAQAAQARLTPSHLFTATGSGGTQAGLIAGLRLAGSAIRVIGLSVSEPAEAKIAKVDAALGQIAETLGLAHPPWGRKDIVVFDDYAGGGYAHPTEAANAWVREAARADGVLLDPVYTGKGLAGTMDLLETGRLGPVKDPVFLHTGGAPALFADPALLWDVLHEAPQFARLTPRVQRPEP